MGSGGDGNEYVENSVHSVVMSAVLNCAILIVQLLVYSLVLVHPRTARAFAPRLDEEDRPKSLRQLLWAWEVRAWRRRHGVYAEDLDGTVLLRFCVLGAKFSAVGSLCACVLIPIYSMGRGNAQGFNTFHISNLEHGSDNFWVVVVIAYLLAALFLHLVAVEWKVFIQLRKNHFERLAQGKHGVGAAQAMRSILVELVPDSCREPDGSAVRKFFEEHLFPEHGVRFCVLHPNTRRIRKNAAALREVRRQIARGSAVHSAPPPAKGCVPGGAPAAEGERPGTRFEELCDPESGGAPGKPSGKAGQAFSKVGTRAINLAAGLLTPLHSIAWASIELARGFVQRVLQALQLVQDISIGHSGSRTAFVTLHSVADRAVAEQLVLSHSDSWRVRPAPEACDIVWRNAGVPLTQKRARRFVADVVLVVGLIFWSVPVGSLQVWTSLDKLDGAEDHPWWAQSMGGLLGYTFLRKYLPVVTLLMLQYALPVAFTLLAREYEGYKVKSEILRRVLKWNLTYQFVTLYVTVLSGTVSLSLHAQLGEVLRNPQRLFDILREEVPQVACYFINYVTARVGISVPMLLFFPVLARLSSKPSAPGEVPMVHPDFACEASTLGVVLVLGLTYSVIAPAIMPVVLLFFALAFMVYSWLFSYVYTPEFDYAGSVWYALFEHSIMGLLLGSLSLAALASAFVGFRSLAFYACLVLCGGIVAAFVYLRRYYGGRSKFLSLEDALACDASTDPAVLAMFTADYYVDPGIKHGQDKDAAEGGEVAAPGAAPDAEPDAGCRCGVDDPPAAPALPADGGAPAAAPTAHARSLAKALPRSGRRRPHAAHPALNLLWLCGGWIGCLPPAEPRQGSGFYGVGG